MSAFLNRAKTWLGKRFKWENESTYIYHAGHGVYVSSLPMHVYTGRESPLSVPRTHDVWARYVTDDLARIYAERVTEIIAPAHNIVRLLHRAYTAADELQMMKALNELDELIFRYREQLEITRQLADISRLRTVFVGKGNLAWHVYTDINNRTTVMGGKHPAQRKVIR